MSNILVKIPAVIGPTMPINRMLTDMNLPYLWCLRVKRASNPAGTWKKREDTSAHRNTPYHISTRKSRERSQVADFPGTVITRDRSSNPHISFSKPPRCSAGSSIKYPNSDGSRGISQQQPTGHQLVLSRHSSRDTAVPAQLSLAYGSFHATGAQLTQRAHGPQSLKYLLSGRVGNKLVNL